MSDQYQDQLAIRALLERYCEGVNQRDADIWGAPGPQKRCGSCLIWGWMV